MKKKKREKRPHASAKMFPAQQKLEAYLGRIERAMFREDYRAVLELCEEALPQARSPNQTRADMLRLKGIAHALLRQYDSAYDSFTQALKLDQSPDVWFNRGIACRFTMRFGRSVRDLERAVELEANGPNAQMYREELKCSQELAEDCLELRGVGSTLDELIEQEELFQTGILLMSESRWEDAEAAFRQVIDRGDVLPQPWGNLGTCLIMQKRYDEAEAALRKALEIEPDYAFAKHNLAALPGIRRHGKILLGPPVGPFDHAKIKTSVITQFVDP
jgi:tetratricopeptide (TPR) repeat protein